MRNIMLYALVAFVLGSCNSVTNDKDKKKDKTETNSTVKQARNEDQTPPIVKGSTYTSEWSQAERDNFVNDCVRSAHKGSFTLAKSREYCSCMLQKCERLYPNPKDANGMSEELITALAKDCLK